MVENVCRGLRINSDGTIQTVSLPCDFQGHVSCDSLIDCVGSDFRIWSFSFAGRQCIEEYMAVFDSRGDFSDGVENERACLFLSKYSDWGFSRVFGDCYIFALSEYSFAPEGLSDREIQSLLEVI